MLTEKQLTKRIEKIYKTAMPQIRESWDAYLEKIKPEGDELYKALVDAKNSGDQKAIRKAQRNYSQWLQDKQSMDIYYTNMLDETAKQIANANRTALAYVNGQIPEVYSNAYNLFANETLPDYVFNLADASTVRNLILDDAQALAPSKFPLKGFDVPKDVAWNRKKINSQILQGVIQGESIPKIAKRIETVTNDNSKAAVRNARSMITSAESKGRQDSYEDAQANGIVLKKVWMSAIDDRTRIQHLELDGVEVDVDDDFEIDGYKIHYPGDPSAEPEMYYNCRCTMKTRIIGFRRADGSISKVDYMKTGGTRVIRDENGKSQKVSQLQYEAKKSELIAEKKRGDDE